MMMSVLQEKQTVMWMPSVSTPWAPTSVTVCLATQGMATHVEVSYSIYYPMMSNNIFYYFFKCHIIKWTRQRYVLICTLQQVSRTVVILDIVEFWPAVCPFQTAMNAPETMEAALFTLTVLTCQGATSVSVKRDSKAMATAVVVRRELDISSVPTLLLEL